MVVAADNVNSGPRLALSREFLHALGKLPARTQKRVTEFVEKFHRDPTQSGINFERLNGAKDKKVRSVRIDRAHRAIVIHPPKGDVFLCVWVDRHDDAYHWVRNRLFEVNAVTGALQVFETYEHTAAPTNIIHPAERGLFDAHEDEWLLLAGVPKVLLPAVRQLRTEHDLDKLEEHLPEDAAQNLYAIASGYSPSEAIEERERLNLRDAVKVSVDVDDFAAALERVDSRATFHIVDNEDELRSILEAPLAQWRVFLHPGQRALVRMKTNGPLRVLGGAGTGKTVALLHRARYLAEHVFTGQDDRLLVTCYNRSLADDLRRNLQSLCHKDTLDRIEVTNLHQWATVFLERHGSTALSFATDAQRQNCMQNALDGGSDLDLPQGFFLDEWDQVVQPLEQINRANYLTARRSGRGRPIKRGQRADIWKVFERYANNLNKKGLTEWPELIRRVKRMIEDGEGKKSPYCAVLADEAQDYSANDLRLLRAISPEAPDTLMLVGDGHQRLHGLPVPLSSCGIEIRGRSRRLKVNYRTTEEIRKVAVAVLEGCRVDDLDGDEDSLRGYRSLRGGPTPLQHCELDQENECRTIVRQVSHWIESGIAADSICVAARTRSLLQTHYGPALRSGGIPVLSLDDTWEGDHDCVRLSTMHRLKGLEFSRVILAGIQADKMPLRLHSRLDEAERDNHEYKERCLFYVAATRARDELVVTGSGKSSPFLDSR